MLLSATLFEMAGAIPLASAGIAAWATLAGTEWVSRF
jgi:hypothetical protein